MLKGSSKLNSVKFSAVGAGTFHHNELDLDIYKDAQTNIFVDDLTQAEVELKTLDAKIVGEVGEVLNGSREAPTTGITIFQSMGIAVEDVAVAEALLQKYHKSQ